MAASFHLSSNSLLTIIQSFNVIQSMLLTALLHNYKYAYFSSGINSIKDVMIISQGMFTGGLLAAAYVSQRYYTIVY
jgi:VanZ family protein